MKKLYLISFLLLFIGFASAQTLVQSGQWTVSSASDKYSLDSNQGERTMTLDVDFDRPFETKPDVFLSVTLGDLSNATNARFTVEAMSVSRDGFTIKVRTWADSKIFSIGGYWLAHAD